MIKIKSLRKPRVDPKIDPGQISEANRSKTLGGDLPNTIEITWYKLEGTDWLNSLFAYRQTSIYDYCILYRELVGYIKEYGLI